MKTDYNRHRTVPGSIALLSVLLFGSSATANAAPKLSFNDGNSSLELTQNYQFWFVDTYTSKNIPETDPRLDAYLRRARFGFKGQVLPRLDYQVQFAFDNLSKDPYTGTTGTPQQLGNTEFKVWDAYAMYHPDSAFANITFGLFIPQVSREMTNSCMGIPSLDNALTYTYELAHIGTRPSGRESGVNIGGLYADSTKVYSASYNLGFFDEVQDKNTDITGSIKWSPLITGRAVVSLGQPEALTYKLVPTLNFFGKRKGLSLGAYGTYQGKVDELCVRKDTFLLSSGVTQTKGYKGGFKSNSIYGGDMLFNWSWLELDAQYSFLYRSFSDSFQLADTGFIHRTNYVDKVWHVRGSVCIPIAKYFIEPTIMVTEFKGDTYSAVYPSGWDHLVDMGVNWYVGKSMTKVSLHYVKQNGAAKSLYTSGISGGKLKVRNDYVAAAVQLSL